MRNLYAVNVKATNFEIPWGTHTHDINRGKKKPWKPNGAGKSVSAASPGKRNNDGHTSMIKRLSVELTTTEHFFRKPRLKVKLRRKSQVHLPIRVERYPNQNWQRLGATTFER